MISSGRAGVDTNVRAYGQTLWPGRSDLHEDEPEEGLERPPKRRFSVSLSNWFLSPRGGVHNRWTVQRYPAEALASHWAEIDANYEPERNRSR